uniref:7TM GPCR serpentine receptor class x (Srx) domain-containing protein n=1 Tax=Strongyloides venezuelensis TaxID=75913 RepID=A0A0K0FAE9_STRVS
MDIGPQLASSIISFILNNIIVINKKHKRNKSTNRMNQKSSDLLLTINLLFHTVCPFILLVYSNSLLIIPMLDNSVIISPITLEINI